MPIEAFWAETQLVGAITVWRPNYQWGLERLRFPMG